VRRPARRISRGGAAWLSLVLLLTPVPAGAGPKIVQDILDNGLKVVAVQDDKSPVSTIQVWYKVGSRHEPQGKTGLSHLLEHMMFKGRPRWAGVFKDRIAGGRERLHELGRDRLLRSSPPTAWSSPSLEADRMTNLLLDPAGWSWSERS
jgi:zinc protease